MKFGISAIEHELDLIENQMRTLDPDDDARYDELNAERHRLLRDLRDFTPDPMDRFVFEDRV